MEWAKQQFRPIFESNKNAFFSFQEDFVIIGDKRKEHADYTKVYFSSYGFEDQLDNALRKWGLRWKKYNTFSKPTHQLNKSMKTPS